MKKSDYESFFSLKEVSYSSAAYFGFSHFFNRAKVWAGWSDYDLIMQNPKGGRILLGLLPVHSFHTNLLTELSPNGLIVACNEFYELAGCATTVQVTVPYNWQQFGIEHHHLPFADFSADVEPALVLETLKKMNDIYKEGGTVYVHCKAGRSRSPLILALFMSFTVLEQNKPQDKVSLENLLNANIKKLSDLRPQTNLDEAKIRLGVKILQDYVENKRLEANWNRINLHYTQSAEFFAKLTQSPPFKALWHFAYNHQNLLPFVQTILTELYEEPLNVLAVLKTINEGDSDLHQACQAIEIPYSGYLVLTHLKNFLASYKNPNFKPRKTELSKANHQLNQALVAYKHLPKIIAIARQIQSDIFFCKAEENDKRDWLLSTAKFLNEPVHHATAYYLEAKNAVLSDDPITRQLGKTMLYIGGVVLFFMCLAGVVASHTFTIPVVLGFGAAALAFMWAGKSIMDIAIKNDVCEHSRQLVHEIETNLIINVINR